MAGEGTSLFEAWGAWADGVDIRQRVLWGMQIFWWARLSKTAAFLAASIIVFDIIGRKRLEQFLARWRQEASKVAAGLWTSAWIACLQAFFLFADLGIWESESNWWLGVVAVLSLIYGCIRLDGRPGIMRRYLWLAEHDNLILIARIVAFVLIALAFHFDFLAS
ncbi:hypothetical protein ACIBH1_32495 [Nonomuraea sp. NPDC050663]|uniref:hypothetical protein n=1 Tax=Nonomuraea sp. NPDC050663 TaxID=3364370 RepID=UPI0037BC163F